MIKQTLLMIATMTSLLVFTTPIYAQEEGSDYEEEQCCEDYQDESRRAHRRRCHSQQWKEDYFDEELHEETGWPGRKDDELSDQLSR